MSTFHALFMAGSPDGEDSVLPEYMDFSVTGPKDESNQQKQVIEFYKMLRPSLVIYLRSMGLTRDEADDVIQESFLRLVRHLANSGKEDNLRSWIFRVAHNLSMDLYRADRRNLDCSETALRLANDRSDPAPNPEEKYLQEEEFRRLDAAISKLTAQQRRCILLRAQGLRYREIAAVLGIGVPTVCDLVHRAIVRLAGDL